MTNDQRSRWLKVCLAMAAVFGTACDVDPESGETPGELGEGVFRYACVDGEDPACNGSTTASAFPSAVATNSSFDLAYDPFETTSVGSAFVIEPVAEKYVSPSGDGFQAQAAGTTAFLARQTSDGSLVDFVHLRVENVASLSVVADDGASLSTTLAVGEEHLLVATARNADTTTLAGSLTYSWTTSDAAVLSLGLVSEGREMQIVAQSPGSAELHVEAGGVSKTLAFSVTP